MKKLKFSSRVTIAILLILLKFPLLGQTDNGIPISPVFFGQNYFFASPTDPSPSMMTGTLKSAVLESGVKLLRYGGAHLNTGWNGSTWLRLPDQIDYQRVVQDIRSSTLNAEPLLQVYYKPSSLYPLSGSATDNNNNGQTLEAASAQAAKIVDYVNNVLRLNVRYWEIANEPNISVSNKGGYSYDGSGGTTLTAAQNIATYFKAIAKAMKDKDPNILIVGPSLSYINTADQYDPSNKINTYLFSDPANAYSIKGSFTTASGATKYYVDVFDFHCYPGVTPNATYPQISVETRAKQNAYGWGAFYTQLNYVKTNYVLGNGRDLSNLKIILTEFNARGVIDAAYTEATCLNSGNLDMRGFAGGQQIADMLAAGLALGTTGSSGTNGLVSMMMWSAKEGSTDTDPNNRGYVGSNGTKRPSFYHYKMLTSYFSKGKFYRGFYNNSATTFPTSGGSYDDVKAFGCYVPGEYYAVMLMNNSTTTSRNFELHLNNVNNTWTAPSTDARINLETGSTFTSPNGVYKSTSTSDDLDPETTLLIVFDCNGVPQKRFTYSRSTGGTDPLTNNIVTINSGTSVTSFTTLSGSTTCGGVSANGSATAIAPSASSYKWYNGLNQQIGTGSSIPNLTPGLYNVVATFSSGCTSSTGSVMINTNSPFVDAGKDQSGCASGSSFVIGSPLNPSTGQTYNWTATTGTPPLNSQLNPTVSPTQNVVYGLTAQFSSGAACPITDNVSVAPKPTVSITTTPSGTTSICQGDAVSLNAIASGGTGTLSYVWNPTFGITYTPSRFDANISTTLNKTTNFNVRVTDANGCFATAPYNITVKNYQSSFTYPTGNLCQSGSILPVMGAYCVKGVFTSSSLGANLNSSTGEVTLTGLAPGTYSVTNTVTVSGCPSTPTTASFTVGTGSVVANAGPDKTVSGGNCATNLSIVTGTYSSSNTYFWYVKGSSIPINSTSSTSVVVYGTGTYVLKVSNGTCDSYDEVTLFPNPYVVCYIKLNDFASAAARCPNSGGNNEYSGVLNSDLAINNDTIWITKDIVVPNNRKLDLTNTFVFIAENVKISVQPGGRLGINGSALLTCDNHSWKGIEVLGNMIDQGQLYMTNSVISGAETAIKADRAVKIDINTSLLTGGITGINLDRNKGFSIYGNTFTNFDVGIKTKNSFSWDKSVIQGNEFAAVNSPLIFEDDDHRKLDIKCNTFDHYKEHAIYSQRTQLQDQGTLTEGAGNIFISDLKTSNHKLYHTGNKMKYFYDPSNPVFASEMTATTERSHGDAVCGPRSTARSEYPDEEIAIQDSKLFKLYPNPNNGTMSFEYQLDQGEKATLEIYDLTGRKISQYFLETDKNSLSINENSLQNGIYFYTVVVNGKRVNTGKIVIIK